MLAEATITVVILHTYIQCCNYGKNCGYHGNIFYHTRLKNCTVIQLTEWKKREWKWEKQKKDWEQQHVKHAICVGEHDSSSLMPTRSIFFHTDDSKCVWEECLRNPICLYHNKTTINTTTDQHQGERKDQKLCSVTNKDPIQTIKNHINQQAHDSRSTCFMNDDSCTNV